MSIQAANSSGLEKSKSEDFGRMAHFILYIQRLRCLSLQNMTIPRAISIKGLYAKMAKLSYIRQINRGNELLLLKESKVRLKVILSG